MHTTVQTILKQKKSLFHLNEGITICSVADEEQGVSLAKDLLYGMVNAKTALYLSGGKTPKNLYEQLAREGSLMPGAVGQVDERFGEPYHANSNQKMIRDTQLLRYLELRNIPFYSILQNKKNRLETSEMYDEKIRSLNAVFQMNVAILGIGSDGHTAGIAGNRKDFKNALFDADRKYLFVSEFEDEKGSFGERVTMTFLGLSMMDLLIVMVFSDEKKEAVEKVFDQGLEEEIPARFYKRPDVAEKTIFITDLNL